MDSVQIKYGGALFSVDVDGGPDIFTCTIENAQTLQLQVDDAGVWHDIGNPDTDPELVQMIGAEIERLYVR